MALSIASLTALFVKLIYAMSLGCTPFAKYLLSIRSIKVYVLPVPGGPYIFIVFLPLLDRTGRVYLNLV